MTVGAGALVYLAFGLQVVAIEAAISKCRGEPFRPRRAFLAGALWPVALGLVILFAAIEGRA